MNAGPGRDSAGGGAARGPGGERILAGRYRLLGELGRGGMGVVWRARDELLGREVAVKEVRAPAGFRGRVLAALRAAHAAGVLHRDVKPGNVLIANDGRVVLTDFGIAVIEGASALTRTGELVGSPEFLAPERAMGRAAGPASDLWSPGVLLSAAVERLSPSAVTRLWARCAPSSTRSLRRRAVRARCVPSERRRRNAHGSRRLPKRRRHRSDGLEPSEFAARPVRPCAAVGRTRQLYGDVAACPGPGAVLHGRDHGEPDPGQRWSIAGGRAMGEVRTRSGRPPAFPRAGRGA